MSGQVVLHHLDHSQSQRILWLLEELSLAYPGFSYQLVHHFRTSQKLAPDSLKAISPTGKAPALVCPGGRVLVESTTITTYLLKTYDTDGRFGGGNRMYNSHIDDNKSQDDWLRDDELTSYASSSLGLMVTFVFILQLIPKLSPWFLRPVLAFLFKGVEMGMRPRLKASMQFAEDQLEGRKFFLGEGLSRPDFIMSFPMDQCFHRKMLDETKYPRVQAWRARIEGRAAWKSGLSKGNGYDWTGMLETMF